MSMRKASIALVLGFGLASLLGCESAVSDDGGATDRLVQHDWLAETISGKPVIHPGRVTMSLSEGRISGRGGCNLYSGPVEFHQGTIKVGQLISTKMACLDDGLMQQESAYLTALESAQRYTFGSDGKLTISTVNGALIYKSSPRQTRPEG